MENIGRREFVTSILILPFLGSTAVASKPCRKVAIKLPPLSFKHVRITGREKGGRLLVIGGIHGNEPGAYTSADLLKNVELAKGEILLVPRANFLSILANLRGYNGDMNRKFADVPPSDPDYPNVQRIKRLISEFKPDAVLSLHDGYGFHALNPSCWGQCIVIDAKTYAGIPLYRIACAVAKEVNKSVSKRKWKIPVFNTNTFLPTTKHPEQRKALTFYCLRNHNTPAFCLEVSKQLPDLKTKVMFHLLMLREFFRIYGIKTKPDLSVVASNMDAFINPERFYTAKLKVNHRTIEISSDRTFYLPRGSTLEFVSVEGSDGTNVITRDVNMNMRHFAIRRRILLEVKDDFRRAFNVRVVVKPA